MSKEKRAQLAVALMLVIIFGGSALITVSERALHYGHGLALAFLASLPLVAVRVAIEVVETDAT